MYRDVYIPMTTSKGYIFMNTFNAQKKEEL